MRRIRISRPPRIRRATSYERPRYRTRNAKGINDADRFTRVVATLHRCRSRERRERICEKTHPYQDECSCKEQPRWAHLPLRREHAQPLSEKRMHKDCQQQKRMAAYSTQTSTASSFARRTASIAGNACEPAGKHMERRTESPPDAKWWLTRPPTDPKSIFPPHACTARIPRAPKHARRVPSKRGSEAL